MYERIERTGVTSPERARVVSELLGASVAMLSGEREDGSFGTAWWLESNSMSPPLLLSGMAHLVRVLCESIQTDMPWALYGPSVSTYLHIHQTTDEFRLVYTHPTLPDDQPYWWSASPASRTASGIEWLSFTKHERDAFADRIEFIASESTDYLCMDGTQVPAEGCEIAYILRRVKPDQSLPDSKRMRDKKYGSTSELCSAIVRQLKRSGTPGVCMSTNRGDVSIHQLDGQGLLLAMRVWWPEGQDSWQQSPWPAHAILQVSRQLEARFASDLPALQLFDFDMAAQAFVPRPLAPANT
jgi:hypothetical protein